MTLVTILLVFFGFIAGMIFTALLSVNDCECDAWETLLFNIKQELDVANDTIEYQRQELNSKSDEISKLKKIVNYYQIKEV